MKAVNEMKSEIKSGRLIKVHPEDIVDGVFKCNKVTEVDALAFVDCKDLLIEVILDEVIKLPCYLFYQFPHLEKCSFRKVKEVEFRAFYECPKLEEIELPQVKTSESFIFEKCTGLKKCWMPFLTKMGQFSVFKECQSLETLFLHCSIKGLADSELNACKKLRTVVFFGAPTLEEKKSICHFFNSNPEVQIVFTADFQKKLIESALLGLLLPEMANLILDLRFQLFSKYAESITEKGVLLRAGKANSEGVFKCDESVTSIGPAAFKNRKDIKEVILPNVTEIGDEAFRNCSMEKLTAPKLETVGKYAFSELVNMSEIDLSNVTTIGFSALSDCSGLKICNLSRVRNLPDIFNVNSKNNKTLEKLFLHPSVKMEYHVIGGDIVSIVLVGGTEADINRMYDEFPLELKKNRIECIPAPRKIIRPPIAVPQLPVSAVEKKQADAPALPPRKAVVPHIPELKKSETDAPKKAVSAQKQEGIDEGWSMLEDSQSLGKHGLFGKEDRHVKNRGILIKRVLAGMEKYQSGDITPEGISRCKSLQALLESGINPHLKIMAIIAVLDDGKKDDKLISCIKNGLGETKVRYLCKNALSAAQENLEINDSAKLENIKSAILGQIDKGVYSTMDKIKDKDVYSSESHMENKNNFQNP